MSLSEALQTVRRPVADALGSVMVRYGLGIALVLIWQLATMRANSIFFPTPWEILQRAGELWLSGPAARLFLGDGVFNDILPSLGRLLLGWTGAVVVGVTVGVLIGRSRIFSDLLDPSLQFLRAVPGPAVSNRRGCFISCSFKVRKSARSPSRRIARGFWAAAAPQPLPRR